MESLLESDISAPPLGAGPFRVTVPVVDEPPDTVDGFIATEAMATTVPVA